MTPFSVRLKEVRKSRKKTQKECADCLGVTLRAYQFYESGDNEPRIAGLIKLSEFFGVTLDYLMGKTDL